MRRWAETNQWDLVIGAWIVILMVFGAWKILELIGLFALWSVCGVLR